MPQKTDQATELQNKHVKQQLEQALKKMEQWTEEQVRELHMTQPGRQAARRAVRKITMARKWLIFPRHSPTERRFLRMMLHLAIATDPALQDRAAELAKYMSKNYPSEWLSNPVTLIARSIARDVILREADSAFGNTPLAGQLAFVLFHHQEYRVENVSDYAALYSWAVNLDKVGFFRDRFSHWRVDLGLPHHAKLRQIRRSE